MKPLIVILDDEWDIRRAVYEQLLGDRVEIRPFTNFSRRDIDRHTLSSAIPMKALLGLNPSLLIADLSVLEGVDDPDTGLSLLQTLREDPKLGDIRIMVVSDHVNDPSVANTLNRLGITHVVYYQDLLKEDSAAKEIFKRGIKEALDR